MMAHRFLFYSPPLGRFAKWDAVYRGWDVRETTFTSERKQLPDATAFHFFINAAPFFLRVCFLFVFFFSLELCADPQILFGVPAVEPAAAAATAESGPTEEAANNDFVKAARNKRKQKQRKGAAARAGAEGIGMAGCRVPQVCLAAADMRGTGADAAATRAKASEGGKGAGPVRRKRGRVVSSNPFEGDIRPLKGFQGEKGGKGPFGVLFQGAHTASPHCFFHHTLCTLRRNKQAQPEKPMPLPPPPAPLPQAPAWQP